MNPTNPENKNEEIEEIQNPEGELIIEHDINQAAQNIVSEITSENNTEFEEKPTEDIVSNNYTLPINNISDSVEKPYDNTTQPSILPVQNNLEKNVATPVEPRLKKSYNKLKLAVIIFAVTILVCVVSASAYAGIYLPNKPNNVVKRSVANVFSADYYNAVKAKLTIQSDGQMAELNTTAGIKNDITRADFGLKYSVFNVEGSAIYNAKDKTTYIKINGLDQLLNQVVGTSNSKVSNSWVKIQDKDLRGSAANSEDTDQLKCLQGLLDLAKTNEFKNELLKTYTSNEFINAEKVGSDKIEDKKASKYLITIDDNKADQFAKQLENSSLVNDKLANIDPKCNESTKNSTNGISSSENMKIENFYVWVNSSKQLVQLSFDISQSNSRATLQLNMLKNSNLDFTIPTKTVDGFDNLFSNPEQTINSLSL